MQFTFLLGFASFYFQQMTSFYRKNYLNKINMFFYFGIFFFIYIIMRIAEDIFNFIRKKIP